jgi:uncharacterized heparinase superfamily protein
MPGKVLERVRRLLKKPPSIILRRVGQELAQESEWLTAPLRARRVTPSRLLAELDAGDLDALWARLGASPYPAFFPRASERGALDEVCPGETARIMRAAERALRHEVTLLGLADRNLGNPIDWHRDYKTDIRWPSAFYRRIEYAGLGRPSDVKIPWEISRLQWLLPAGQAYRLSGDDRYAAAIRAVLEDWIAGNPFAWSVNWTCAMEVALRVLSWTWFFHACHDAPSWKDEAFRRRLLTSLYLHGDFIEHHLEFSDINGNHYTADAAGLVFAGLFFGEGASARRWASLGWQILSDELPRQVTADGVDFEASVPYHRLVLELFLVPAMYRLRRGLKVEASYRERLIAMARFAQAYTRDDGSAPVWGDADDARALPFGDQAINDHAYLPAMVGFGLGEPSLMARPATGSAELVWLFGLEVVAGAQDARPAPQSTAFPEGGFFVMRGERDHVFIDCGPIGLGGRGGHGHNDCLAFEAVLDGVALVIDCGAYVYTASVEWRNHFRTTPQHNTPQIAGAESNRLIAADQLWTLHDDATPEPRLWQPGQDVDLFVGAHSGYRRLDPPATPVRAIRLDKQRHALVIEDRFEGSGGHPARIPFHLAPGAKIVDTDALGWVLEAGGRRFRVVAADDGWTRAVQQAWVSPSYGVKAPTSALVFSTDGLRPLRVAFIPEQTLPDRPDRWLRDLILSPTAHGSAD